MLVFLVLVSSYLAAQRPLHPEQPKIEINMKIGTDYLYLVVRTENYHEIKLQSCT